MTIKPKRVFAMDIGTRSVVGVVAEISAMTFRVLAMAKEEYQERAMLSGQIQDVDQVARVVAKVKQKLEQELGLQLRQVAVAAAGRALITVHKKLEQDVSPWHEITEEQVTCLELDAIRQAQQTLFDKKGIADQLYCVGYSTCAYYLDGKKIGNPVGQRGSSFGIELIATFLPRMVVDSLIAVLERNELEMELLTLEPIAALEYVIPTTMRGLNLALVDIGAGTSDIAITAQGSVTAYDMVPLAGDKVTEELCNLYLLDFFIGEKMKRQLAKNQALSFQDVLGVKHQVASTEVIFSLKDVVHQIAYQIGERIVELNEGPPQAVICIGGGSLTPGITNELAEYLGLPEKRVAVRSADGVRDVKGLVGTIAGPDGVTPLGIALMATKSRALGFSQVQVNDKTVKLFRGASTTVGEALLAAKMGFTDLCGRPGRTLTVEVNGELRVLAGETGKPAEILLNGSPANLDTVLPPSPIIEVGTPKPGRDASALVGDLLPPEVPIIRIRCNGREKILRYLIYMNGRLVEPTTPLVHRAQVSWRPVSTVLDALLAAGLSEEQVSPQLLRITVNGHPEELWQEQVAVTVNGIRADLNDRIHDGDFLSWKMAEQLRLQDLASKIETASTGCQVKVFVNGERVEIEVEGVTFLKNERKVKGDEVIEDGDDIRILNKGHKPILTDVFKYISFEPSSVRAFSSLVTLVNGEEAQFTTPLKNGDKIRIFWRDGERTTNLVSPKDR
jgi:cell division protein FtsA